MSLRVLMHCIITDSRTASNWNCSRPSRSTRSNPTLLQSAESSRPRQASSAHTD